jgi:manganese efflux pump family protein
VLAALSAAGCGAQANGAVAGTAAGSPGASAASVRACSAYGVHAIEHHITVRWMPAPCHGLSKTEVNQAVAMAVVRVAGDVPKAVRRKRAAEAVTYLEYLVSTPPPGTSRLIAVSRSPAPGHGKDLAMGVAALAAWLVTAGSGAYVLGSWIAHGGKLRRRAGSTSTGSPPTVIFGHFGLALSGLVIWVAYLVTGWAALAWTAVGVLLPVAGLGMATLVVGLPGYRAPAVTGHEAQTIRVGAGDARTISCGKDGSQPAVTGAHSRGAPVRARLSPLVVAGHGLLAVTTMLLVLLAALGTAAN